MFGKMNWTRVFLAALLCLAVGLLSSAGASEPQSLTASAESLMGGGNSCSDFMDGAALGLAFGVLFGCIWCGGGALAAKFIGTFVC